MFTSVPPLPKIDSFVDALEQLIKLEPRRRGPAPQVLLVQLAEGTEAERIADGLCGRFSAGGRARIPFAQVAGAPTGPRRERVGETFQKIEEELLRNRPAGSGRLRLSQYRLLSAIVEAELTESEPGAQAKELRDQCYAARCRTSVPLSALEAISGGEEPPPSVPATAWYWLRRPLFGLLPRWWYGRRHSRRMTRKGGWYRKWAELPERGAGFFTDARRLAMARIDQRSGRDQVVDALLRALLADLQASFRHTRLSPWGRRRRHRFVIVLPQIRPEGSRTDRLLRQFPEAVEQTGCTGVLLVAAAAPDEERAEGFAEAAVTLRSWIGATGAGGARSVRVGVRPEADDADAARWFGRYPEIFLERTHSDLAPRLEAALATAASVTALALLGTHVVSMATEETSTACLGRSAGALAPPKSGTGGGHPSETPKTLYDEAWATIEKQNAKADKEGRKPDVEVRTVAYLGVPVTVDDWQEAMYSGAIPELRGIALAQAQLNREALHSKREKVWIKIRPMDAGEEFAKAPARATELVAEARAEEKTGKEDLMGVVGLGQSRTKTIEARDILAKGGLPMIGTVATAEEMQDSEMYHQVAPDNGREARIAADFARHGNIVRTGAGSCAPAREAVVVGDPDDIYSRNLSQRFAEEFDDAYPIWYSGDSADASGSPTRKDPDGERVADTAELADTICERLQQDPRTVVYWAARSNEFEAFLYSFNARTVCGGKVTVLGGNDLTNAVVEEQRGRSAEAGLRLYYAAHALPRTDDQLNVQGRNFRDQYGAAYGQDLWSNDGRSPLAYDALRLMFEAINEARGGAGEAPFGRGDVQARLREGTGGSSGVRGATGSLVFEKRGPVPVNKRLLILHDTSKGPEVALDCGVRDSGDESTAWGPRDEFDCPQDDVDGQ